MTKIGILKNHFFPQGWHKCDWTERILDTINIKGMEPHLIDGPEQVSKDVPFYLTRMNHDAGEKNTARLSQKLDELALQFEKRRSMLIPNSYNYRLYENKEKIANLFGRTGVKCPKSYLFNSVDEAMATQIEFPVVIKHPFSCASNFMLQAYNSDEFHSNIKNFFNRFSECLVQEKISFTREARVIFVGDEAIHGYFRFKKNEETMSASTAFGSYLSFDINLQRMSEHISDFRKRTNIEIGAVDMAWANDDLNSEPYYFEVSPIFGINPVGPSDVAYKKFKGTPEYHKRSIEIRNHYYSKVIDYNLEKASKPIIYCDIDFTINDAGPRIRKWTENGRINPSYGRYEEVMLDPCVEESRDILNNAKDKYRIIFMTARAKYPQPYLTTRDWLVKNNFHYDQIIITRNFEEKLDIMKREPNLSLFIDDLTRGHHESVVEVKKQCIKDLIYNNIPFVRYDNNWDKIKEMIK